jgi:hypothetical protein
MTCLASHRQPFSAPRHDALFGEAKAAATPDQAASAVSAARTLSTSLDRRSPSGFDRSPQGPMVGSQQRKRGAMTHGFNHVISAESKDEWLTPPHIIKALGHFDLDPCAPHFTRRPRHTAGRHYSGFTGIPEQEAVDGLSAPWEGRVWCIHHMAIRHSSG